MGAALRLAAERGPRAVTIGAVAAEVGAPTGSIYHRYQSREELLAELWMGVVEAFQAAFVASLTRAGDVQGAVQTARTMARWARQHPLEARLLLLHRRQDFVAGAWPPGLVGRAAVLEPQMESALSAFARRCLGRADADARARARFALVDGPLGAIKPYLQAGKPVPRVVDDMIEQTVRAVLGGPGSSTS